jgi:hypothetical protein
MNKEEFYNKIADDQLLRVKYCESDFLTFFLYYFEKHIKYKQIADFHKEWIQEAMK